ncbi:MAG TPA: hypothetical protein VGO11_15275 [Chthoniobacteraceae bacterium]|jgi:hypothetical protein|nr:hypothetical protein [Chthoniobacteraceae bacterium]
MVEGNPTSLVDDLLDAVSACLDRTSAEALVRLRAPAPVQHRMELLADRCTEGLLTAEEREEYEELIQFGEFVSILQANVRRQLAARQAG